MYIIYTIKHTLYTMTHIYSTQHVSNVCIHQTCIGTSYTPRITHTRIICYVSHVHKHTHTHTHTHTHVHDQIYRIHTAHHQSHHSLILRHHHVNTHRNLKDITSMSMPAHTAHHHIHHHTQQHHPKAPPHEHTLQS